MSERSPEDLPALERERMHLAQSAAGEIVSAAKSGDDEGFNASFAALRQLASQVDIDAFLNSLHVPEDAGEHAEALRRMLLRIPDGWGRWISCGAGWYPLLARLEEALAALSPDYEVHQIKEKYGSLRFYADFPFPRDLSDSEPAPFLRDRSRELTAAEQALLDEWVASKLAWNKRQNAWREGAGRDEVSAAKRRGEEAAKLIKAAEAEATRTCEDCGRSGQLMLTQAPSPWYKTLCSEHAADGGYINQNDYDAWWDTVKDEHQARSREFRINLHRNKRILVCSADQRTRLLVDASYAATAVEVEALLDGANEWDEVFFADDEPGLRAIARLEELYLERGRQEREERGLGRYDYYVQRSAPTALAVGYLSNQGLTDRLHEAGLTLQCHSSELYADQAGWAEYEAELKERVASRTAALKENRERRQAAAPARDV